VDECGVEPEFDELRQRGASIAGIVHRRRAGRKHAADLARQRSRICALHHNQLDCAGRLDARHKPADSLQQSMANHLAARQQRVSLLPFTIEMKVNPTNPNLTHFSKAVLCHVFLGALLLATALSAGAVTQNDQALWRPRFATPAIVALDTAGNREFTAEVRAPASVKKWQASLANDLRTWPCKIVSATYAKINRDTEPGWRIKVAVPGDISPELFNLTISSSEGVSVQNQCVSISQAFATNFYLLHITDEQIVNQYHTDPSGQYYKMVGTWEEMKWMQEPVNLINPRFVIVTGDQIDFNGALDGWNNWVNWGYAPKGKKNFTPEET